jgi:hypothetical protein
MLPVLHHLCRIMIRWEQIALLPSYHSPVPFGSLPDGTVNAHVRFIPQFVTSFVDPKVKVVTQMGDQVTGNRGPMWHTKKAIGKL